MKEPKEVDGIFQADNPMPEWWKLVWLLTIIFSIFYVIYFHYFSQWGQEVSYQLEVQAHEEKYGKSQKMVVIPEDGSNPFRDDEAAIAEGQKNYLTYCAACHKQDGTGLVGPNLMDAEWLHGDSDKLVYANIMKGIAGDQLKTGKGPMPAHENSAGSEKVFQIMAWLAKSNSSLKKGN